MASAERPLQRPAQALSGGSRTPPRATQLPNGEKQKLFDTPDVVHWAGGHTSTVSWAVAHDRRVNLTIRRSIAGLARRSWSTAHSLGELALQFEWWRAYYHFARPHAALRQSLDRLPARRTRPRYRSRTPAQAAGLAHHRWTVLEVLISPALPMPCE